MESRITEYDNVDIFSQLMEDERSRQIFWARLRADVSPSWQSLRYLLLASGVFSESSANQMTETWLHLKQTSEERKPLFLYGAGEVATGYVRLFQNEGIVFDGFCDSFMYGRGYCGKPIISPVELRERLEDGLILITTAKYHEEIAAMLRQLDIDESQILPCFETIGNADLSSAPEQYFEFPELIPRGRAFVDGGCFDGTDSLRFLKAVSGEYSRIYAFEPDEKNYQRCEICFRDAGVSKIQLITAGLSEQSGTLLFHSNGTGGSHLIREYEEQANVLRVGGGKRRFVW